MASGLRQAEESPSGQHYHQVENMPKPAKCGECSKTFPSMQRLRQHERCHNKKHVCEHPKCSRKFATVRDLRRHQQIHDLSKGKRQCLYCEAMLDWRPDNFQRHIDTNHNGGITAAAFRGDAEAVELYLAEHPESINAIDGSGQTALWKAILSQHYQVAQFLIQQGAEIDVSVGRSGRTILSDARNRKDEAAAMFLIDKGASLNVAMADAPDTWPRTPVGYAAYYGLDDMLRKLVQESVNIEEAVLSACQLCSERPKTTLRNCQRSVETLLKMPEIPPESISRISTKTMAYLCRASRLNRYWVSLLVEYGADVNCEVDGKTILMLAAEQKECRQSGVIFNSIVVIKLLEAGANVNAKARNGWTALHVAVSAVPFGLGWRTCAEALLRHGADCQAVTETGDTPLDLARSNRQRDGHGPWERDDLDQTISWLEQR
ncbi:ankyrin repeat-containing domain protein [Cercophora newfieldiana]|uniref:Ankyrin repeat-containing domain protein n=1 Tax=Cercophora newfieldiana TaxID=92897 RepID=A0AA39YSZ7_9PEZI|nr:ankyrin repeat-containing domain protein [Cercophora newfieldiana]